MNVLPISVLIPTMNRPETLKATLDSFFNGDVLPAQVVVVDQSNDENAKKTKNVCDKYSDKAQIKYVYQERPSSTEARNNAYNYASGEIIVFSDDDVLVYKNTLKNVVSVMQRNEVAMIAGIDDNSSASSTNIGYLLGTKSYKNRKIGHVTLSMLGRYPDNIKGEIETQWAMGYFFVVRKSLLDKWNIRWDENLTSYAYAEDLDFSFSYYKKAKSENLKCVINEQVRVKHCVSKEYRTPITKSTYMYVVNRYYLSYKHNMGFRSRLAMKWCNFWRLVERTVKKECPADMWKAMVFVSRNKKDIRQGKIKF